MDNPIIVALDVADAEIASHLVEDLGSSVAGFKVGSELFTIAGPDIVRRINKAGRWVFLDLKFHDIPNTVAKAVAAATKLGVYMLNVHTSGGLEMMKAAKQAALDAAAAMQITPPLVLGVTVLTSLKDEDMNATGVPGTTTAQVERLARLAMDAKLGGLICSSQEVGGVRKIVGPDFQLVTPGIRLPGADQQDQKRTGEPKQAITDGANWLVIGRPITGASNPKAAAEAILASLN